MGTGIKQLRASLLKGRDPTKKTKFRIGGNGFPWWVDFLNGGEEQQVSIGFS